jgi:thymidine kinase
MFARKTTFLVLKCAEMLIAGKRCCIIRYIKDNRYSVDDIITHSGIVSKCKDRFALDDLAGVDVSQFDVIFVDEVQFYKNARCILDWMREGKYVYCTGLNGDYLGNPWPNVVLLSPYGKVKQLFAICAKCKENNAVLTKATAPMGDSNVRIGIDYEPMCTKCGL